MNASAALWKRNVVVVWVSQFLSIGGFAFSMPFAPFFIQELGITDDASLRMWVALFSAATPLTIAISSPIWGMLSDRYGHRLMLLRANFAAMIVLFLMSKVPNVEWLIACRLLQGLFTGTLTAAQTMVVAASPTHRSGLALGGLSSAVFCGAMVGAALGGVTAEAIGYRDSFMIASLLTASAGILVLVGTRNVFEPPEKNAHSTVQRIDSALSHLRPVWFILLVVSSIAVVRRFDEPFIPLWVQHLHGDIGGSAARLGLLFSICSVAGFLSGICFGRLADRMSIAALGKFTALGAAFFMILQGLVPGFGTLIAARWGLVFFAGGLDPVIQAWLAKSTSPSRRGLVFGAASSARALGWALAALLSGTVAATTGLRSIFFFAGVFFLLLIPMIAAADRSLASQDETSA